MKPPRLVVPRAEIDLANPWRIPPGVESHLLVRTTDAGAPALSTRLAIFRSGDVLNALFLCDDDYVTATMTERDESLYEEDAVEIFLSPRVLETYYELEANPLGALFDARISSPDGDRRTMHVDRSWDAAAFRAHVRKVTVDSQPASLEILMSVPLGEIDSNFEPGAEWRANFYRIDRKPKQRPEFSAWSPTLVTPADFHVPSTFGTLVFD